MQTGLATIFVYLNDLPEDVGETHFPKLQLSVTPRAGVAVLFPNVDEAGLPDVMTVHEARPVPRPHVKWGLNIFIADRTQQAAAFVSTQVKVSKRAKV